MKKREGTKEYLCFNGADIIVATNAVKGLDWKKRWRVTIAPYAKNRTTDQNNLLWASYTEISEHTGHTPEEIHEYCKATFLPAKFVTVGRNTLEYRTTTKLTTTEMMDYTDRIRAWAQTELGMTLSVYGEP